jgi:hypothetical protein
MHESSYTSRVFFMICTSFGIGLALFAQDETTINMPRKHLLQVYIDYPSSDNLERFLRSEIPFASYVRDPLLAQIHILITDQTTGSGGKRFTLDFIGQGKFSEFKQKLFYISPQSDTDEERRVGIARIIKMGLMPYVSQTEVTDEIEITYNPKRFRELATTIYDPWDHWIFSIDLGGSMRLEETRDAYELQGTIEANRVTEEWKLRHTFYYVYEEENFTDDDKELKSTLKEWKLKLAPVRSLSSKWSAGIFGEVYSTTYRNIELGWNIAPAIEYNFFRWPEAERRMFTISYRAGYTGLSYFEETLYNKKEQQLFFHALKGALELTQPWGNLDIEVEASQYPELKNNYSIKAESEMAFRITGGLEFVLESKIESIHDQIYLPKGDATLDEILLRRRQLETTYDFRLGIGLRYTFGSIYNNIINHRL